MITTSLTHMEALSKKPSEYKVAPQVLPLIIVTWEYFFPQCGQASGIGLGGVIGDMIKPVEEGDGIAIRDSIILGLFHASVRQRDGAICLPRWDSGRLRHHSDSTCQA